MTSNNHPSQNWRKRWKVDRAARVAHHDSGLSVRFDAGAEPISWEMTLASPLPAGYNLDPHRMRKTLFDALRIWQESSCEGLRLSGAVMPSGTPERPDLEQALANSKLAQGSLQRDQLQAIHEDWRKARLM
jgi:hypothetical protein